MTYTLIKYEDEVFDVIHGLTREALVKQIAGYYAGGASDDDSIFWCHDKTEEEIDEDGRIESEAMIQVSTIRAEAKRLEQQKRDNAKATQERLTAYRERREYERLRAKFENPAS